LVSLKSESEVTLPMQDFPKILVFMNLVKYRVYAIIFQESLINFEIAIRSCQKLLDLFPFSFGEREQEKPKPPRKGE